MTTENQTQTEETLPASWRNPAAWPKDLVLLGTLAAFKLLLHLFTNAFGGYEIFRDELYYLACADHLALGYVDHPPLSIWILAGVRTVVGDSLFLLRLLPAVIGACLVLVTGLLAREMGGGRHAILLAALCSLVSGEVLAVSSIWSMNGFDLLFVALAMLCIVRLINGGDPRTWLLIGLFLGLGLFNKVGVLWVGLGVAAGLIGTSQRRWLTTRWPWLAGVLAMALFSPYIVWNLEHQWPHLEFIGSAVGGKYSGLSAWSFLSGQLWGQNPTTLLVWLFGLGWLLFGTQGRRYRFVGLVWITACLILVANGHSKSSYLANLYAPLFAAGGVFWERRFSNHALLRFLLAGLVALGLVLAPFATPILPVETFISFASQLDQEPTTDEGHQLESLPQFYADMFGWRAKAEAVATAMLTLSEAERKSTVVFSDNYGRAAAIDYWREEFDLPPSISGHNNYWLWGPGDSQPKVVIVLGGDVEKLNPLFESVELAATATCQWCLPYEQNLRVYLCRGYRAPLNSAWDSLKHYD